MSEHVSSTEGKKLLIDNLLDGQGFVKVVNVSPDLHPVNRYPEYLVAKTARAGTSFSNGRVISSTNLGGRSDSKHMLLSPNTRLIFVTLLKCI